MKIIRITLSLFVYPSFETTLEEHKGEMEYISESFLNIYSGPERLS